MQLPGLASRYVGTLEVLQEEHEEDLQIAGSPAGANPDERGGLLGAHDL